MSLEKSNGSQGQMYPPNMGSPHGSQGQMYPPNMGSPHGSQGQMYPPNTGSPPAYSQSPPNYGYGHPPQGPPMQNYHPGYGQPIQQPMQSGSQQQQQQTNVVVIEQPKVGSTIIETAPRDYTASAIAVTLCCCFPLGIAAIVSANNANTYARQLNMDEAHIWANRAKILIIVSIVCGLAWIITVIAVQVSAASSYNGY